MVITRVGVGSAAKIWGILNAVIGVIAGGVIAVLSTLSTAFVPNGAQAEVPTWLGPLLGVGAIVVFPILYGVIGAVVGALLAAVYNLVAGMAGGLRIEAE